MCLGVLLMSLTFANFRQIIPAQILMRGREYVQQGNVLDLSFDEEEIVWEAQVEGTEVYDVRIEQAASGSLTTSCSCPYEYGEHCKHVAAVLYAIEKAFPEQLAAPPRRKAGKRQTRHDKLRQQLEKASREQLVKIVLELAEQNREVLNQLLIRLDSGATKPMDYRRVVKDALRAGKGDYGYLDYTGSNRAGRKIGELLTQAGRWLEAGEIAKAVGVYQAVIDETVPAISHADDSSGALGGCISIAVEGLGESMELQDEAGREALFAYCLERARRKDFEGWDWGWDLLNIAEALVENPARRALFVSALEDIEAEINKKRDSMFFNRFSLEKAALFKLSLIERFDGKAAGLEFLRAHAHLDKLRMLLIARCMDEGASDEAMRLIEEGIKASEQSRLRGLTHQYQALRVKLLRSGGDKTSLIQAARALWLNAGAEDQFALLKEVVPAADWPAFVEGLVKDLRGNPTLLAWLYAQQGRWADLMALVQAGPQGLWLLENYREALEEHYPETIGGLYEKAVEVIMQSATGRDDYQRCVVYLRRMKALDLVEQAEAIVQRLKERYPRRRAMFDELSRL